MMLTPVTEAKSASDQLRDSRRSRIAAPADSRLTAALRPYSDITQPSGMSWVYTFLSRFSCQQGTDVYTLLYTKEAERWVTRAQSTQRCGSATPTMTVATAPPRRAPTNSPPLRRG